MSEEHRAVKILLVEDNLADARLTLEAFGESHILCQMQVVCDSPRAMQLLRKEGPYTHAATPDLILLDLRLPGESGHDLLRHIKNDPALGRIPVIVLTCSDNPTDAAKSYELHASCHLTKPAQLEDYKALVRCVEKFWLNFAHLPEKEQHG